MNNLYNTGYFFRELKTIFKLNIASNILSIFSTGLLFFILAMVVSGWLISDQVIKVIERESEISIYLEEKTSIPKAITEIEKLEGVRELNIVDEEEAYNRMEIFLGEESMVLSYFEENPFSSYVEVMIDLENIEPIIEKLNSMDEIQYIRDNREILYQLYNIQGFIKNFGYLALTAVGITTFLIISYIIRQGIHSNKEQIITLRLLGAPEYFIACPFLLEGFLITLGGGIFAVTISSFVLNQIYVQVNSILPFIPMAPKGALMYNLTSLILVLSGSIGVIGGIIGMTSAKR